MSGSCTRREFIVSVLGAAAALPLPAWGAAPGVVLWEGLFRKRALDVAPILAFVAVHLSRHPEESGVEALEGLLFGGGTSRGPEAMRTALLGSIKDDFTAGRTTNIDGWVLSLTEVRLWCLYVAVTT